jgi:NitT/TauT family transport system permease protein
MHIRLRYAVPYIFSALKIATTLAVIGAVVAEFVAAERGLGFFILFSTPYFKIPQASAGLAVLMTLSLVLFGRPRAATVRAVVAAGGLD